MFYTFTGKIRDNLGWANIFLYTAALVFAVIIKIYSAQRGSYPGDPLLQLFLKPLSVICGLFFGISFEFDAAEGFVSSDSGIIIGTGCAGVNFFVIAFCMLVFIFMKHFKTVFHKLAAYAACLAAAYVFSLLANASRIIASITILKMNVLPPGTGLPVHELTGILFYLVYLILGFYIAKKLILKARLV